MVIVGFLIFLAVVIYGVLGYSMDWPEKWALYAYPFLLLGIVCIYSGMS